jgi:SAM-dependent methyltransferase
MRAITVVPEISSVRTTGAVAGALRPTTRMGSGRDDASKPLTTPEYWDQSWFLDDVPDPTPSDMIEQLDVVTSFGVVEHFERTDHAVEACARYLLPGGMMLTAVPTMRGPYGLMYRLLQPEVYRSHVPQSREALAKAHLAAGVRVVDCIYVLGIPTVLTRPAPEASALWRLAFALSSSYFWLERCGWGVPSNGMTSPYVLCVAAKPKLQ